MIQALTYIFKKNFYTSSKAIRYIVYILIKLSFQRNKNLYYSRYYGSDNMFILIIKNIFNPARILEKLRYGTIFPLPQYWIKGKPAPSISTSESRRLADQFKQDGFLMLSGAHPELADHIQAKYSEFINSCKAGNNYNDLILREIDQKILDFIVNDKYLQVIADYYNGRQPYLRATGSLKVTNSLYPYPKTSGFHDEEKKINTGWHYDTVNMVQIHFLLHDLEPTDTHMKLTVGKHRTHRINLNSNDYYYSDEYIDNHYKVIPVCGKKGTVFIWDSNAPHRAHPVVGRPRSFLQLLYSPGNDILTQNPKFGKNYSLNPSKLNLHNLSPLSHNALKYIIEDLSVDNGEVLQVMRTGIQLSKDNKTDFEVSNF